MDPPVLFLWHSQFYGRVTQMGGSRPTAVFELATKYARSIKCLVRTTFSTYTSCTPSALSPNLSSDSFLSNDLSSFLSSIYFPLSPRLPTPPISPDLPGLGVSLYISKLNRFFFHWKKNIRIYRDRYIILNLINMVPFFFQPALS